MRLAARRRRPQLPAPAWLKPHAAHAAVHVATPPHLPHATMASHGHSASRKGGHVAKHRPVTRSNKIINPNRTIAQAGGDTSTKKKGTHLRDNATIKRLAMYKDKPIHNSKGEFLHGAYMSRTPDAPVKRILGDRRLFGNTRVVGQTELANFREAMGAKVKDPYTVVMRSNKLPTGLLTDKFKVRSSGSSGSRERPATRILQAASVNVATLRSK